MVRSSGFGKARLRSCAKKAPSGQNADKDIRDAFGRGDPERSGSACQHFYANESGKQVLGRIPERFFATEDR
jgi:hypothetical protein